MAPLEQLRIDRAYHEVHRHPGILDPNMTPLIDIILEHKMIKSEIIITEKEMEWSQTPIEFQKLCIRRRTYDDRKPNELPVYTVAPFSIHTELNRGNSKDWFSWRLNYPLENGQATILWHTHGDRFDAVEITYSMFNNKYPTVVKHPFMDSYIDTNGKFGFVEESNQNRRFGVVFAGCELVSEQSGIQIPHQVLVFG
jgi:hypothetical protein